MRKYLVLAVFAIFGVVLGLAQNANAAGGPPVNTCTTTNGVTNCIQLTQVSASKASDKVSDSATAVSKAVANAHNLIAMHLKFNETAAKKANKCFWGTGLNGGYWIGHPGYTYQRPKNNKPIHWCYDAKSKTHYIKIGGGDDNEDCHNAGIPDHKPKRVKHPFVKSGLKTVMHAATSFKATATATSVSLGSASAYATAHNEDYSCNAQASATESSYGYAYAKATAYGSTKSSAIANAKGKLAKVEVSEKTHTTAEGTAKAKASTKASGTASAEASCTPSIPPAQCQPGQEGTPPNCHTPSVDVYASVKACQSGDTTTPVVATVSNPNLQDSPATGKVDNGTPQGPKTAPAGGSASFTFNGLSVGTHTFTGALTAYGLSKSVTFTVAQCSPPVVTPPHILEVCTVNDVLISNTRTCTVSGTVASGHTAQLFATAKNGGTITVNKTQTVSGSFTVTVTYLAPSEVPGSNGNIAAGKDRIDFTLTQDDGQSDSASTNQFGITQPVPDPL